MPEREHNRSETSAFFRIDITLQVIMGAISVEVYCLIVKPFTQTHTHTLHDF